MSLILSQVQKNPKVLKRLFQYLKGYIVVRLSLYCRFVSASPKALIYSLNTNNIHQMQHGHSKES